MPDAIALGELLIDFVSLERDAPLAALPRFAGAPGGAPANVAVGLARQGVRTGFIGKVGRDPFGDRLRATLEAEGVEATRLGVDDEARTTLAFVATRSDGRKDIAFYRNPGADMRLEPDEIEDEYLRTARLFHFGSVSLSEPPARHATLLAARLAKKHGLLVSYDPNWRPTLWADHAEARRWIWKGMAEAQLVHCAEEEWEFITGTRDPEAGARKIHEVGPDLVVVTRGEHGCYYHAGAKWGQVPGFVVETVDPLGAGDAFVAAMLAQFKQEEQRPSALCKSRLDEIMTYANAAGALTCTKPGVIPSLPRQQEIEAFLATNLERRGDR